MNKLLISAFGGVASNFVTPLRAFGYNLVALVGSLNPRPRVFSSSCSGVPRVAKFTESNLRTEAGGIGSVLVLNSVSAAPAFEIVSASSIASPPVPSLKFSKLRMYSWFECARSSMTDLCAAITDADSVLPIVSLLY